MKERIQEKYQSVAEWMSLGVSILLMLGVLFFFCSQQIHSVVDAGYAQIDAGQIVDMQIRYNRAIEKKVARFV